MIVSVLIALVLAGAALVGRESEFPLDPVIVRIIRVVVVVAVVLYVLSTFGFIPSWGQSAPTP
jgi:hypothetical protein